MIRPEDVLPCLGMKSADEAMLERIRDAIAAVEAAVDARVLAVRHPVARQDGGVILAGSWFHSRALCRILAPCGEALVFCATLGAGVDRLVAAGTATGMSFAVLVSAAADALLHSHLRAWEDEQRPALAREGLELTRRMCPGYFDWPIQDLPRLLPLCGARHLGVATTGAHMLTPMKSLAGLIGLAPAGSGTSPVDEGCGGCTQPGCAYRKE